MTSRSLFLNEINVDLDGSPQCMHLLKTHGLADELVPIVVEERSALELIFEGGRLKSARKWRDGYDSEVPVHDGGKAIRLADVPQWPLYRLVRSRNRTGSQIGGRAPTAFVPPEPDHVAPFQYLGTLTPALTGLEWLPIDLHLTAPTLNGYNELYIDYRDPLKPALLDEERSQLGDFDFVDDVLTLDKVRNMKLGFRTVHLRSIATNEWRLDSSTEGHIGIPHWIQFPRVPVCPLSGNPMWFVCEFSFDLFVDVVSCSTVPVRQFNDQLQDVFASVRYATFYVFLEPDTRIGCIVFQMN